MKTYEKHIKTYEKPIKTYGGPYAPSSHWPAAGGHLRRTFEENLRRTFLLMLGVVSGVRSTQVFIGFS